MSEIPLIFRYVKGSQVNARDMKLKILQRSKVLEFVEILGAIKVFEIVKRPEFSTFMKSSK